MAEYNAGSIEASLELGRDPFIAGIAAAKQEGKYLEDHPIVQTLELKADVASAAKAQQELESATRPVETQLKTVADLVSLASSYGIMSAAVRPIEALLKATPDNASVLAAQAEMQALVGHTIYDPVKAVPDLNSAEKAIDLLQLLFENDPAKLKAVLDPGLVKGEWFALLKEMASTGAPWSGVELRQYAKDYVQELTGAFRQISENIVGQIATWTEDYIQNQFLQDFPRTVQDRLNEALQKLSLPPVEEQVELEFAKDALAQLASKTPFIQSELNALGLTVPVDIFGGATMGMSREEALKYMRGTTKVPVEVEPTVNVTEAVAKIKSLMVTTLTQVATNDPVVLRPILDIIPEKILTSRTFSTAELHELTRIFGLELDPKIGKVALAQQLKEAVTEAVAEATVVAAADPVKVPIEAGLVAPSVASAIESIAAEAASKTKLIGPTAVKAFTTAQTTEMVRALKDLLAANEPSALKAFIDQFTVSGFAQLPRSAITPIAQTLGMQTQKVNTFQLAKQIQEWAGWDAVLNPIKVAIQQAPAKLPVEAVSDPAQVAEVVAEVEAEVAAEPIKVAVVVDKSTLGPSVTAAARATQEAFLQKASKSPIEQVAEQQALASVKKIATTAQAIADANPVTLPVQIGSDAELQQTILAGLSKATSQSQAKAVIDPSALKTLASNTREYLDLQLADLGLKPGLFETKGEAAAAILKAQGAGAVTIPVNVKPNLFSMQAAYAAFEGMASGDPLKLKAYIDYATALSNLPEPFLQRIAQSWGMELSQAMAYETKAQLAEAMMAGAGGGGFPPPPTTEGAAPADKGGPIARALTGGALATVATHALGLTLPHLVLTGVSLITSAIGAALGGAALGTASLAVGAVGIGTDLAGIGQAAGDIKSTYQAMTQLNQAVATFGPNSTQAAQAAQQLQTTLAGFSPVARGAVVQAANTTQQFKAMFDQLTGPAEKIGAEIINQAMLVGEKFLPTIGKFAAENMAIIQKDIQPLFAWFQGQGLTIFTNLEKAFQKDLPYTVSVGTNALEIFANVINHIITSPGFGNFIKRIADDLARINTPAGLDKLYGQVDHMIAIFRVWEGLGKALYNTIKDLLHVDAGTGTALVVELTKGLQSLDKWLVGPGGSIMRQLFQAHKEQAIAILQAFGILLADVGPPLIKLFTDIAKASIPLIPIVAEVIAPFIEIFAKLLDLVLKIPGVGNLVGLYLVLLGFTRIPWFGIGKGFDLFLGPLLKLMNLSFIKPLDMLILKLGEIALGFGPIERAMQALAATDLLASTKFGAFVAGRSVAKGLAGEAGAAGEAAGGVTGGEAGMASLGLLTKIAGGAVGGILGGVAGHYLARYTEQGKGPGATVGRDLTTVGGGLLGTAAGLAATGVGAVPAVFVAIAGASLVAAGEVTAHWKGVAHEISSIFGGTIKTNLPQEIARSFAGVQSAVVNFISTSKIAAGAQDNLNKQVALMREGKGSYEALDQASKAYETSVKNQLKAQQHLATEIKNLPKSPYADQLLPQTNAVATAYERLATDTLKYGAGSKQVKADTEALTHALDTFHAKQQALATGYTGVQSATDRVTKAQQDSIKAAEDLTKAQEAIKAGPSLAQLALAQYAVSSNYDNMIKAQKEYGSGSTQYKQAQDAYNASLSNYTGLQQTVAKNAANLAIAQAEVKTSNAQLTGAQHALNTALADLPKGAAHMATLRTDAQRVRTDFANMTEALHKYGTNSPQFHAATAKYQADLKALQREEDNTVTKTHHTSTGIVGVWQHMNTDARHWFGNIEKVADTAWQHVDTSTRHWFGNVEKFFKDIGSHIATDATHWANNVYKILDSAWQHVDTDVRHWFGNVLKFFEQLPGNILKALGNLGSLLLNAGKSIAEGFAHGITSGLGDVVKAAGSLAHHVEHAITHPWEIVSPSHKAERFGASIAEGFALGLTKGSAGVEHAALNLSGAAGLSAGRMQTGGGARGNQTINIHIYNPQPQAAEASLHRTMQRIKFHGLLPDDLIGVRTLSG